MKLIIDISKEDYKESTDYLRGFNEKALKEPFMNATLTNRLDIALLHGTPLDDVRAEIEEYRSTIDRAISEDELKIEGMKEAYTDCLKILDNIGNKESEEE